jgi:aminoglycoside phosphotransferase (APT) family kinase protein
MSFEQQTAKLENFFSEKKGVPVSITNVAVPTTNGFSSLTLLLQVTFKESHERWVVQIAPDPKTALFKDNAIARSFRVQRELGALGLPVPKMLWLCEDPHLLGEPFYVMEHVSGLVPPDRPAYHKAGWFFEASSSEQAEIWCNGIRAMARIHETDIEDFDYLNPTRKLSVAQARLETWTIFHNALGDDMHPALDAALQELRRNAPDHLPEKDAWFLHWGDAKPGNMIFERGDVQAVLDWELCGLSAREEDLAHWLAVDWFLSSGIGVPRIKNLPGKTESIATYQDVVKDDLHDMNWWFNFALVRMGCIFQRAAIQARKEQGEALRKNTIIPHLNRILSDATWSEYA